MPAKTGLERTANVKGATPYLSPDILTEEFERPQPRKHAFKTRNPAACRRKMNMKFVLYDQWSPSHLYIVDFENENELYNYDTKCVIVQ